MLEGHVQGGQRTTFNVYAEALKKSLQFQLEGGPRIMLNVYPFKAHLLQNCFRLVSMGVFER